MWLFIFFSFSKTKLQYFQTKLGTARVFLYAFYECEYFVFLAHVFFIWACVDNISRRRRKKEKKFYKI